ncbi:SusC/RagA family TonB-linked outer membrane protein [Arachidicoccus terrestris]|uniref:SusC/RagA family TonB-linked outer membrane protein n=1 Tax=Arachidicoccus terrestris TaxID=2875539 RepID=UPI001CC6FE1D|nr:TonB-dependent receptor [Arachidicoccus terrestris]
MNYYYHSNDGHSEGRTLRPAGLKCQPGLLAFKSLLAMLLSLFAGVLFSNGVLAQSAAEVSGIVQDQAGTPLGGVSVEVKTDGSDLSGTRGSLTDNNGKFTVNVAAGDSIIFSYVGFQRYAIRYQNEKDLHISLVPTASRQDSVVVIGYQTVLKKDLTGATGVVDMDNSTKVSAGTVAEGIQGLVPGVTVRNGGAPGQNSVIEIRGVGSFQNASPLYVIDGMLSDANVTINPDDIASIQVLKDASAAAIYGSRAGNGVVIITTKRGRAGAPVVSLSGKYGLQQLPKTWDVMDATGFLATAKQQYTNSGVAMPKDIQEQLKNNTINVDWQDAVYRTSAYQDYTLGVSGGSNTANYYIAGSYYGNEGTVVGNKFTRASLRINTEVRKGRVTFGEHLMLTDNNNHHPGGGVNVFYNSAQMLPIIMTQSESYKDPIQYPSNPAGWGLGSANNPTYANNYLAAAALDRISNEYGKLVGNGYLQIKLADWLTYKFNAGLEVSYDYTGEIRDTGVWRYTNQPAQTFAAETRSRFTNLLLEHTINFDHHFGKHYINGVVGFSRTQQDRSYTGASRTLLQNLNGNLYSTISSAIGTPSASGGVSNKWRSHGWLGRVNYNYADRYLLTLTGRIDQDSRFGPDYRTGYFPSAAAAWRVSKEDFFTSELINDLKIRASYGQLGFSDALAAWQYVGYVSSTTRAVYGTDETPHLGQYQAIVTNPDLHWEKRNQLDIGADITLLDNRLDVSLDWYRSTSDDVLLVVPLPQYLGSSGSPFVNTGSIRNTGIEFSATYRDHSHALKWDLAGNFTTIKNKVLSVGNQGLDENGNKVDYLQPANFVRSQVGHPMASWYVIQTDGIFQSAEEVNNYKSSDGKIIQPNAKPGDIRYIDLNDDGQINDNDRSFHGSPWPTLQAGLQFNASYRGFTLNMQWIGIFGNQIYDDVRRPLDSYQLVNFRSDINPWTPDNTNTDDPRLAIDNGSDPSVSANNMAQTDRWLESGSYARLRNLEIGYSFATDWLGKMKIRNARVFVSGQNLFTITKYRGLDPDVANGNLSMRGMDSGFWPSSRIYSLGIHMEF